MTFPEYFDEVRTITLYDPLAEFLGAADGGLIEYTYHDAVKLAGHSCPTIAGAYLVTLKALERLYPDGTPERGAIKVSFREQASSGVTGVMANIATLLTGCTHDTGFKGIGGRFDRRNLLFFAAPIGGEMQFARKDNGTTVLAAYHPEQVPPNPAMKELLPLILAGAATRDEGAKFATLWQERVRRILIEHVDDPSLVVLS